MHTTRWMRRQAHADASSLMCCVHGLDPSVRRQFGLQLHFTYHFKPAAPLLILCDLIHKVRL